MMMMLDAAASAFAYDDDDDDMCLFHSIYTIPINIYDTKVVASSFSFIYSKVY